MTIRNGLLAAAFAVLAHGAATTSSFYLPIRNNDPAALRKLIRDAGPNTRDSRGNSPLMYAAALGTAESMRLLLEGGADPNVANDFGATPLMWCAGDAVKVRMLLAKGAAVNAKSKLGRTPLLIAAAYDGATEAARLMMEKGADVNARDEGGMSVLEQAAYANHIELAKLLLDKGAKTDTADGGGFTPLMVAAWSGDRNGPLVRLLLAHGAAVNAKSGETAEMVKNGPIALGRLTALQLACGQGGYDAVEALVRAGADVNAMDVRKATPLVFAVATDHADAKIARLLIEKGADRAPAKEWAERYNNPAILPLFGLAPGKPAVEASGKAARNPREAVEKALAAAQGPAAKFLDSGGCVSCHAQHLNGLAVSAAKQVAIHADYDLEARESRITGMMRGGLEQQLFQVQDPPAGVDSQQFSLMQMAAAGVAAPSLALDSLAHHIAAWQRKEGDWPNYGVVRPPLEDGGFSHTAKGIRALAVYPIPGRKAEFDERIARAAHWLEAAQPVSTEDRTMQILGIVWAGRKAPAKRVQQLMAMQRADGGWGQTESLPADAYASGEALWALHEAGVPSTDAVFRRGVDYLLRTQQQDGTWHVVTRALGFQPYFQSGFPHGHDQWISQSGTAMAAIGLSFAAK